MKLMQALGLAKAPELDDEKRELLTGQMERFLRCGVLTLEDWAAMDDEERRIAELAGEAVFAKRAYAKAIAHGADPLNAARLLVPVDGGKAYAQEFLERKVAALEAR